MSEKEVVDDLIYNLIKQVRDKQEISHQSKEILESYLRQFDLTKEQTMAKGVVAIAINPNGEVVSEGTCFENFAPGGMDVSQIQARTALKAMKKKFAQCHLNYFMNENIDGDFANEFWKNAIKHGYKVETIKVGYPKKDDE